MDRPYWVQFRTITGYKQLAIRSCMARQGWYVLLSVRVSRLFCSQTHRIFHQTNLNSLFSDSPARCLPSVNTNPVCENNQINLTCSVTFHGRYPPVISFLPSWMGVVFNKSEGNEAKYINSFYASRLLNDLSIQSVTNFSQPTSPNVPSYTILQSFPSIFQCTVFKYIIVLSYFKILLLV